MVRDTKRKLIGKKWNFIVDVPLKTPFMNRLMVVRTGLDLIGVRVGNI